MKRIICLMMCLLCLCGLGIPVSARSNAQQMQCEASVGKDGGCNVTISATVIFDETVTDPAFPIPEEAVNVTLNGGAVNTASSERAQLVSLNSITGGVAGTHSIVVTYRVDNAVQAQKDGTMVLSLPILVGFAYPVDALTVTVNLPGEVTSEPAFISGYYQEHTDKLLKTTVSGSTVTIVSQQTLLDHETLTMTLQVDESMFPRTAATARVLGLLDIAVILVAVLALVYYMLALRPALPRKVLRSTAPDGVTAGEIPVWFIGGTVDLSMLVVAWAQLGYLRIQVEPDGRVLLHKRMEMGNERSAFENRCYKNLFGRRRILDGTSDHYARMVRSTAKKGLRIGEVYQKKSGNPRIFRAICALSALLSGIILAETLVPNSGFVRFLVAVLTAVLAVLVQSGARGFALRRKLPLWLALVGVAVWLVLGIAAGQWLSALLMAAFQFLAGILAAYGGKRTELGQQALTQILGLRKFMCSASKPELQRLLKSNPGYFHELAPYALALGVDRAFAARFAQLRIPECTYLVSSHGQMTASQWAAMLRKAVDTMDAKARRLPLSKRTGR